MNTRVCMVLTCATLSFACAPSGEHSAARAQPPEAAPGGPSAPTFTQEPDVTSPENAPESGPDGEAIVTVEGTLDIDRVAGGKAFQGVWLETSSITYVLAYRPAERYFPFQGKRVAVTGYIQHIPDHVQQIGATHFIAQEIALAPGESPHDPTPTGLLAPPMVRTKAALMASSRQWIQAVGTLTGATPDPNSSWVEVSVDVDGVPLTFSLADYTYEKGWAAHEGEVITVTGRFDGDAPSSTFHTVPRDSACVGDDPSCWTR